MKKERRKNVEKKSKWIIKIPNNTNTNTNTKYKYKMPPRYMHSKMPKRPDVTQQEVPTPGLTLPPSKV